MINACLLFILLTLITGAMWRSAFAALIVAFHPVNVDSVVWIAERKTLVCAFFWLLSMGAYHVYIKKPSVIRYVPLILLFTAGLLTKPVMVTFPCVLILLDYWPYRRIHSRNDSPGTMLLIRCFIEKVPLFCITALWFITPFLSETLMSNETLPESVPYSLRISNVAVSYVKYIGKFFWPQNLAIHYPYPESIPLIYSLSAAAMLVLITVFSIIRFRKYPFLFTGWFWFAGTLFPTSGLILGTLWPEMADRWAYIPFIGLAVCSAWSLPDKAGLPKGIKQLVAVGVPVIVIIVLGITAKQQTRHWKNSISLFRHALSITGYHYLAHQNIAAELMNRNNYEEAMKHLQVILRNEPEHTDALYNMALALSESEKRDDALKLLETLLSRSPDYSKAWIASADILDKQGETDQAIDHLRTGLTRVKHRSGLLIPLAYYYMKTNRYENAELTFIEALSLSPKNPELHFGYGNLLLKKNKPSEALPHLNFSVSHRPESFESLNSLGVALACLGNHDKAVYCFKKALTINPDHSEASLNLKQALSDKHALEHPPM